jgi:hypothetical protein
VVIKDCCGRPAVPLGCRGRPQEYSPKARLLNLLGYKLPFDRHDWIVDRCGEEVRWVGRRTACAMRCAVELHRTAVHCTDLTPCTGRAFDDRRCEQTVRHRSVAADM